jgi:hypothetical protein
VLPAAFFEIIFSAKNFGREIRAKGESPVLPDSMIFQRRIYGGRKPEGKSD